MRTRARLRALATICAAIVGATACGYAFNGVKFDPSTAGTCTVSGGTTTCSLIGNTGTWNIEALGQSSFNFGTDASNAHVQPTGEYHYHGMPEKLLEKLAKGNQMTLVGWATDGFPVYAKFGYTNPNDSTSPIKILTASYRIKATPSTGRPAVSLYPMGTFAQDYEYVAGLGDLDECNGRSGVTPEFPQGTYHYVLTSEFPFIPRQFRGTPDSSFFRHGPPPMRFGAGDVNFRGKGPPPGKSGQ